VSVNQHAAQIGPSREVFEHATVAHNNVPPAAVRLDAIRADFRSGTDLAMELPSQQRR
jgi:hypothetical protein